MPRHVQMSRTIGAITLLMSLLATLVAAPTATAQAGNSSLEVHNRICPEGYEGDNWFEDCHGNVPDPDLPFTFTNEDTGETYSDTTNENGNVGFANLSEGTYTLSGGAPGDFADHVVYCAAGTEGDSNQQQIPIEYVTTGVQLELPADTNVICDWYEIPQSQAGDTPETGEGSIEVHNRICPEGYDGSNFFEDCHGNVPDPGLPFTFTDGVTREGTTNENGNVGFANLPAGTYTITGGAPGDFAEHVVYCAVGTEGASNQEQIPVEYVTTGVQLELPADTNVICDWYEIPYDLQGEQPAPTETPVVSQEQFDLPIFALLCDTDPGASAATDFVMMGTVPRGCEQYAGAPVTVSTQDGSAYGTCETTASGPCTITVATGTTVVATIDPSGLPADTTVLGGTTQQIEVAQASEAWVLFTAVPTVQTPEPTLPTATTEPQPEGRTVAIHEGTCAPSEPGAVAVELPDLTGPEPGPDTATDVIIAETSSSTIGFALNDLMDGEYSLIAYSEDAPETPVACTDIDGEMNANGELVLGLQDVNDSGDAGIVYLAPSDDDPTQTDVSVFLAEGIASEEEGVATPGA